MKQELKDKMNAAANDILCATEGKYKMATRAAKAVSAAVREMHIYDVGAVQGFDLPEDDCIVYGDARAIGVVEQLAGRYNELRMEKSTLLAEKHELKVQLKRLQAKVAAQDEELDALRDIAVEAGLHQIAKDVAEIKAALRRDKAQPETEADDVPRRGWRLEGAHLEELRGFGWHRLETPRYLTPAVIEAVVHHHNRAIKHMAGSTTPERWRAERYSYNPGRGIGIWSFGDKPTRSLVVQTCVDKTNDAAFTETERLCMYHNTVVVQITRGTK